MSFFDEDEDEFYGDDANDGDEYDSENDGECLDRIDVHEQIVIETPVSFSCTRETGSDGKKRFYSPSSVRKEVVSTIEFSEKEIIDRERAKNPEFSFMALQHRPQDQFTERMGKTMEWTDINEDSVLGE